MKNRGLFDQKCPTCGSWMNSDDTNIIGNDPVVRQDATLRIAAMSLLPLGVTLLWHAFAAMRLCEAHKTMWITLKVDSDYLLR